MGLQDALYKMNISFDTEQAVNFSDEMQEFVSYYAILSSSELAKERGAYESFRGSKWDRGIFPLDTLSLLEEERGIPIPVSKHSTLDWQSVKEQVKLYGMRNSNTMAIAPTATIANISGVSPSIEPIYKNLYVKSNVSGEFTVVNKALVLDLKSLGLWGADMVDKLKYFDGSVQAIDEIPLHIRSKYKETFEIDPSWTIKHAAVRGKWIDQSQSINIFTSTTSGKKLSDIYMDAWTMGLKTTYYLRSLGATSIEKSTIDINKKYEKEPTAAPVQEVAPVVQQQPEAVATPAASLNTDAEYVKAMAAASSKNACSILDPDCEACQ
jgi:ribonucleoside-diphosphate reductase alpha chain